MPDAKLPDWFEPTVAELLGCSRANLRITQLAGGANNRVFLAEIGERRFAVKWYFTDPEDLHNRFLAEWTFVTFAKQHGITAVPTPIASDATRRMAVFEFVSGRKLDMTEIGQQHVDAAFDFLRQLNAHRHADDALCMPLGAEACFSLAEHLACVGRRVDRLRQATEETTDSTKAIHRIQQILVSVWNQVQAQVKQRAVEHSISQSDFLPTSQRILSPSDFGFHNALVEDSGRTRFIDFEYAGWDDPTKTICDFFCQLAVPVPLQYWSAFAQSLKELGIDFSEVRARLLLPVYRLKWCCIVLNPLLRLGRTRRTFSGHLDEHCLDKAENLLSQLQTELDADR